MTGYGIAQFEDDQLSISVEIKTLNSKFLDCAAKLPKEVSIYENEIRKIIGDKLVRGKANFTIEVSFKSGVNSSPTVDQEVFDHYKAEFSNAAGDMKITDADLYAQIMKMSDVLVLKEQDTNSMLDKAKVLELTEQAIDQCDQYRIDEGKSIEEAMIGFGKNIAITLEAIKKRNPERIENIKSRINASLEELESSEKADPNRFEQELIYYIEKLDISEEFVRLGNHIEYYQETLASSDSQGKKLGFISQEMGREINTIGSKANDSEIQRLVVEMKDELEKIKEQVLNIV